jgi:hypothetical protein
MVTEWYLRYQLQRQHLSGGINNTAGLLALARLRQLIIPSSHFLYAGPPVVRQYFAVQDQTLSSKQRVLQWAASLAKGSENTLLMALERAAREANVKLVEAQAEDIGEVGVAGKIERTRYILGNAQCMQEEQVELGVTIQTLTQQFEVDGKYTLFLAQKQPKKLLGIFACEYEVRPELVEIMNSLRELQVEPVLLTGASVRIARSVAEQTGIPIVHGELDQPAKNRLIATLQKQQPATALLLDDQAEVSSRIPCVVVGSAGDLAAVGWVPELNALPALIKSAQNIVQRTRRRLVWCKI